MRQEYIPIPTDWVQRIKLIEHEWGEPEPFTHWERTGLRQVCKKCGAELIEGTIYYYDCNIMTEWPAGDDQPCWCNSRRYLEAHDLMGAARGEG